MLEGNEKLVKLNFSPGIKAKDINYNFDVIDNWIAKERRRIGGYGLVDGFELTANLKDFTITVAEGTLINENGQECAVAEHVFTPGEPEYVQRTETVICPADGIVTLSKRPYSPSLHGYLDYVPPVDKDLPAKSEFSIDCIAQNSRVYYLEISENKIYVSRPEIWRGKEITFTYYVADDRIDSILLDKNGKYLYHKSIVSTSPSHIDEKEYEDCMLVGVVEWHINTEHMDVNFYYNHRTYRRVYVDGSNTLYLNGKPYTEPQFVYFEEPEIPLKNDLWYDGVNNRLMIWKEEYGERGWVLVNDCSTFTARECKVWKPEDNPEDLQTFIFAEDETNMDYTMGTNALQVTVNNVPIMTDQITEIKDETTAGAPDYLTQGIGFKLKEPLDEASYVECIVHHQVRSKPVGETFQRAAIFIVENYDIKTTNNGDQIFKTSHPYVVGANQIEVFSEGLKLVPDVEFQEMIDESTAATEENKTDEKIMSYYFKVLKPIEDGKLVNYKISKHVWNYNQIALLIGNTTADIEDLKKQCSTLRSTLSETTARLVNRIETLDTKIEGVKTSDATAGTFMKKTDKISISNVDDTVKNKLISGSFLNKSFPGSSVEAISGYSTGDYIQVFSTDAFGCKILVRDVDYELKDDTNGLLVELKSNLKTAENSIYITGFKIGV